MPNQFLILSEFTRYTPVLRLAAEPWRRFRVLEDDSLVHTKDLFFTRAAQRRACAAVGSKSDTATTYFSGRPTAFSMSAQAV